MKIIKGLSGIVLGFCVPAVLLAPYIILSVLATDIFQFETMVSFLVIALIFAFTIRFYTNIAVKPYMNLVDNLLRNL